MRRRLCGWGFVLAGVAALTAFFIDDARTDGFSPQGLYGLDPADGRNWAQKVPPGLARLAMAMLFFATPAVCLFAFGVALLGLDRRIAQAARRCLLDPRPARFALVTAAFVFVATQLVAAFAIQGVPLSDDEDVYLFQARILAGGHLTTPSPPLRDFFHNVFLINDGRMYGQYPLGHPLALVPGVWLGRPSLVPSILAAATVVIFFLAARRIADERTARLAALLLAASPWFLCTSATLLSQPTALFLLTALLLAAVVAAETGKKRHVLLAGICGGLLVHVRPSEVILWSGPMVLYLLGRLRARGRLLGGILMLSAVLGVGLAGLLALNLALNGDPLVSNYHAALMQPRPAIVGIDERWDGLARGALPLGFGKFLWGIEHTPRLALHNAANAAFRINLWLLGLPFSLLLPLAGVALGAVTGWMIPLAVSVLLAFAAYFFYFWPGIADTGPVLYYPALLALALLAARGLVLLAERPIASVGPFRGHALAAFLACGLLVATITFHAVQFRALHRLALALDEPYRLIAETVERPALVFFPYYVKPQRPKGWHAGRRNNTPGFADDVLYVLDLGLERGRELIAHYPDRKPYRFRYVGETPRVYPFGPRPDAPRFTFSPDGRIAPAPAGPLEGNER